VRSIELDAQFGEEMKRVEVTTPMGAGCGIYHVPIDRYYNGQFIHENERWRCALHPTTILYGDVQILIDMLDQEIKNE